MMQRNASHSRDYARRLTWAMAVALLIHACVFLLPTGPLGGLFGRRSGDGLGSSGALLGPFMDRALLGAAVQVRETTPRIEDADAASSARTSTRAQAEVEVAQPRVPTPTASSAMAVETTDTAAEEPPAETVPQPVVEAAQAASDIAATDAGASAHGGIAEIAGAGDPDGRDADARGSGAAGGGLLPVEVALVPRIQVHPDVPFDVLRKRKIMDFVLLQARVGIDGHVREVRVLRTIRDCDECTQSAVRAVRRYQYRPQPNEVWTTPIHLAFRYKR